MNLTCQWCGEHGPAENFDLDEQNNEGFWCPNCDGFTYYDDSKNCLRRILLILEQSNGSIAEAVPHTKLKKRLSPLRYPGGKSKLIDYLATQFKSESLETFVEVFAGGASVGLALLDAGLTKRLVINDVDSGIYAFWNQVVSNPEPLIHRITGNAPTLAEFKYLKSVLDDSPKWHSQEELAWATLVCNRLSYSGISKANAMGGANGSVKQLLARWKPAELQKRIQHIHNMADRITVSCVDAVELLESSVYWDEKSTCFIDPPYVAKGKALYRRWYEEEDHEQLAFIIQSLYQGMPGADLVITYDDCPLVREIYPLAKTVVVPRNYSINNIQKGSKVNEIDRYCQKNR